MPRNKQKKTKAETSAEQFFPVDPEDIKHSVEKMYKETDLDSLQTIEKIGEKKLIGKSDKTKKIRKIKSKDKSTIKIKPQKIELKEGGYELIVTEKPQAALKIASALGKLTEKNVNRVSYYEVERNGKKIIVACAVGHLFTLKQNNPGPKLPVFDIGWVPNYLVLKKDFSKRYYDVLVKLVKNAGSITIATDYDIEGEVIGLNIVKFIAGQKDANRMKFSTLTEKELNDAYESKNSSINWGQAIAGETRHYLDWFYGINLSRALMNAIKLTGKFKIMSIGRVQGPALNLIVKKERNILSFKSQPYWQVFITLTNPAIELKYTKDIFNKAELSKFKDIIKKKAIVSTTKTQQTIPPSPPFNLTNLQIEAYALHGITPANTLRAAQSLYLKGLISYPRTSSQKLPSSIDYKTILKKISKQYNAEYLIKRNKPVEGSKTDPAHPSIYPTGNISKLERDEEKIYNLIVRRFLSLFCDNAIIENKIIKAMVDDLTFATKGSSIKNKGWMEIYPAKIIERELPDAEGEIKIGKSRTEEKQTQPPRRYSPASIISELEKRDLGTKATRAAILETLYDRGYIKEKSIEATPLGMSLISTLEKHSPIIIDEELTRSFEKEMDVILKSKKDLEAKEEKIKEKAKSAITEIIKQFEKEGETIGEELVKAQEEERANQREKSKIMPCPVCNKGTLAITYSKKNRRFFIACDAYPNCKTTYSLPPYGSIRRTESKCWKCNFPLLMSLQKGRKPWTFCFNRECPTNKERLEKYREKKENNRE